MREFIIKIAIIIIVIAAMKIILNFIIQINGKSNIKQMNTLQKKYDSVELNVNRLNDSLLSEKATIVSLSNLDNTLIEQYKNKKEELKSIQNEIDKQNIVIDNLNCIELELAFTKRYDTLIER
jgi:hypothetical protein